MNILKDSNFVMIHRICKMLVLLKNHLNYLKDMFSNAFLRSIIDFYLFFLIYYFFQNI